MMVQKAPAMTNLSRHAKAISRVHTRPLDTRPQQSAVMAPSRKKTVQDARDRWRRVGRRSTCTSYLTATGTRASHTAAALASRWRRHQACQ